MKRKYTYRARFWNAKPILIVAEGAIQAEKAARGVMKKVNERKETNPKWVFQSVGIVCRF